jgi:hypothetical protein
MEAPMKRKREVKISIRITDTDPEEGPQHVYLVNRVISDEELSRMQLEEACRFLQMLFRFQAEDAMVQLEKVDGGTRMAHALNIQGHPLQQVARDASQAHMGVTRPSFRVPKREADPDTIPGT